MSKYVVIYTMEDRKVVKGSTLFLYETMWRSFDTIAEAARFANLHSGLILRPVEYEVKEVEK